MSSGLFDDTVENENVIENNQLTSVSIGNPVKIETKTTRQRNKEKFCKKKDALARAAKQKRIQDNKLFRLVIKKRKHLFNLFSSFLHLE